MNDPEIHSNYSAEELERIARIDKLDANQKRKKLIFSGVTVLLILFFVGGTALGARYIFSYEGTEALPEETAGVSLPEETALPAFLRELISQAGEDPAGTKVDVSTDLYIPEETLACDDPAVLAWLRYVREYNVDVLKDLFYADIGHTGSYGEALDALLPDFGFSASDTESLSLTPDASADDTYLLDARFNAESTAAKDLFALGRLESRQQAAEEYYAPVFQAADLKAEIVGLQLNAGIRRTADPADAGDGAWLLNDITLIKTVHVEAALVFENEYASLGQAHIAFDMLAAEKRVISRIGFSFDSPLLYLSKGDNGEFRYTLETDEPHEEADLVFESSDPSVLSVDKYGIYKAKKLSDAPVTVTGTYTRNGRTYTDVCEIVVRVALEDVKLKTKSLSMQKGETYEMAVRLKPKNASIPTLRWFTGDESVAKVDENGVITAVGEGNTAVWCISVDGNFKRSCAVTVNAE